MAGSRRRDKVRSSARRSSRLAHAILPTLSATETESLQHTYKLIASAPLFFFPPAALEWHAPLSVYEMSIEHSSCLTIISCASLCEKRFCGCDQGTAMLSVMKLRTVCAALGRVHRCEAVDLQAVNRNLVGKLTSLRGGTRG